MDAPGNRRKFDTAEQLQEAVYSYYQWCTDNNEVANVAGLAFHLGYSDRSSVYDLEAHPRYSHVIKQARLAIEAGQVSSLCAGRGWGPGLIFTLKNHHGYKDERHITETSKVSDGPELVNAITRLLQETKLLPQHVVDGHVDNHDTEVINSDNTDKSITYDNE